MAFIRGELRFKNAELINALQRKKMSLTDLSKKTGIHYTTLCNFANMKLKINKVIHRKKLQKILNISEYDLFYKYEDIKNNNKIIFDISEKEFEQISSISVLQISDISSYEKIRERNELIKTLKLALNNIPNKHYIIFYTYFFEKRKMREIADKYNLTSQRISELIRRTIKKIRHSEYCNELREYLDIFSGSTNHVTVEENQDKDYLMIDNILNISNKPLNT